MRCVVILKGLTWQEEQHMFHEAWDQVFFVSVFASLPTCQLIGKSAGNRWRQNSSSNSGAIRRQPFGMNRSGPLDSEGLQPNTARR